MPETPAPGAARLRAREPGPAPCPPLEVRDLGLIGFEEAFLQQEQSVAQLRAGGGEKLLLLEHTPIYTIGAGGDLGNLLDPELRATRINRGGDVTYHGPGQLVGYPIVDLVRRGRDLHRYLRFLESFLIEVSAWFGVAGHTVAGKTGVWTDGGKLASIGVGVRQWVTMHGFCLNVGADTTPFDRINPCGMARCPVTALSRELGAELSLELVKRRVAEQFAPSLDRQLPPHFTRS